MRVISVNVGLPRTVQWKGTAVTTGIFKAPVPGRIKLRTLNFDGDRQADLSVHGGPDKAVYAYPIEHYPFWHSELPDVALPWGVFGENLTTEGLPDSTLNIGARLRIGSAELAVVQPRMPCYKLGLKFGRDDIVRRFFKSGRLGIYFKVVTEGEVQAGDELVLIDPAEGSVPVSEVMRLYARDKVDLEGLLRIVRIAALPDAWRDYFLEQIAQIYVRGAHARRGSDDVVSDK